MNKSFYFRRMRAKAKLSQSHCLLNSWMFSVLHYMLKDLCLGHFQEGIQKYLFLSEGIFEVHRPAPSQQIAVPHLSRIKGI